MSDIGQQVVNLLKPNDRGKVRLNAIGPNSPAVRGEALIEIPDWATWMSVDERQVDFKAGAERPGPAYRLLSYFANIMRVPLDMTYSGERACVRGTGDPEFYNSLHDLYYAGG